MADEMARITVSSFDLPDGEDLYFRVVAKMNGSARGYVSECVRGNLLRMRNIYRDRIAVKANELDLTWEQCFNLYLNYEPPFTPEQIEAVKQMKTTVHKDYGHTSLGNEEPKK